MIEKGLEPNSKGARKRHLSIEHPKLRHTKELTLIKV
jgi:hypothetical protein